MRKIRDLLASLYGNEDGQTAVEYMLIIAVIVGVIMALGDTFKKRFQGLVNKVFSQIDRKVQSL